MLAHSTAGIHEMMNPSMAEDETKRMEAAEVERVMTPDDLQKDQQDYGRIDVSQLSPKVQALD